ncbi:hypothetical protein Dimus_038713 [Dionaea muscipula]
MERNFAELSAMFGHAMARDKKAFKSREETRRLYQESLKENKRLMEELAMKDSALTSREADLAKMAELFSAEEQRRSNLETILETIRREKEEMEAMLEQEKNRREQVEKDKEFLNTRLRSSKSMQEILAKKSAKLEAILVKGMEKLSLAESHLPRQMEFAKNEAIRLFLESDDYKKEATALYKAVVENGFELCKSHVRALLEDDDELIPELEGLRPVPVKGFTPNELPNLQREPTLWTEDFPADPMEVLSDLGKELVVLSFDIPPPLTFNVSSPLPQISSSTTPQDPQPTSAPSSVEPTPPPPQTIDNVSEEKTF